MSHLQSSLGRHVASGRTDSEMMAEYKRHQGQGLAIGLLVVRPDDPDLPFEQQGWVAAMMSMLKRGRGG